MGNETIEQMFGQEEPEFFYGELKTVTDLCPDSPDYVPCLDEALMTAVRIYCDAVDILAALTEEMVLVYMEGAADAEVEKLEAEYRPEIQYLLDQITNSMEAMQGLEEAINELTEVRPLRKEGNFNHAHLYTIRENQVYATCADPSVGSMISMAILPINPADYDDKAMIDILTVGGTENVDVYEVTNPSKLIPPESVLSTSLSKIRAISGPGQTLN